MRNLIFVSSGILFIGAAVSLAVIGAGESDSMFLILLSMAMPFFFTGYWNLYQFFYERSAGSSGEYFSYKSTSGFGIGAFYNEAVIVPVFLIMFGQIVLAIGSAFLAGEAEDAALVLTCISFIYGVILTIYFSIKISKQKKETDGEISANEELTTDKIAIKVAFFFASVATLGLFPLVYFIVKGAKRSSN